VGKPAAYNRFVIQSVFEDMKTFIGFGQEDAENLRALAPVIRPAVAEIVEHLYQEISRHAATREALAGSEARAARLRQSLTLWINSLFSGSYSQEYLKERAAVGQTYGRVELDQRFMLAGVEFLRQELVGVVRRSNLAQPEAKLASLHKLLTLDSGLMLESYKEAYSARVRETERSLVQDKLTRAEHLAEIGSLAASIAHEVKNPLAGISGAIQVIRKGLEPDDPRRPIIAEVLGQIDRLDSAVKDLLLYARPNPPRIRQCDLDAIINRMLKLLGTEPDLQPVRVDYQSDRDLPPLPADEAQIEQVLMNLLLNAAQASREGDTISINVAANDSFLRLVLRDNGQGMDDIVRQRMFEPFFTTKARGTGLGLSICRKIVEAHHGRIDVETELGEGTTVTVDLPTEAPG